MIVTSSELLDKYTGGVPTTIRSAAYGLDSAYREVAYTLDGVSSSRMLDGANKMLSFLETGVSHAPIVDGDPAEAGMNQYSELDGAPRSYNPNGGLEDDSRFTYRYDGLDRLVDVQDSGVTVAQYAYDAHDRRALAFRGSDVTRYISSGWQVLEERDGNDVTLRQYVEGDTLDSHVAMLDGSGSMLRSRSSG